MPLTGASDVSRSHASRAMLEAHFGFTGLSRYERMLALEDATKKAATIEGEFTVSDPSEEG